MKKGLLFCFIAILLPQFLSAQLVINEVCSANGSIIADFEGDYKDWLELYNPTDEPIDLKDYYFETFDTQQKRWIFPNVTIKPDSCLFIFCSQKDRKAIVDHYEIPISPGTLWRYQLGIAEPDPNWTNPDFNDASWASGSISIGYGDDDDETIISPTTSLYLRDTFSIPNKDAFLISFLGMDYDDSFVAYLNGIEVARNNIWNIGRPPFNAYASEEHEAAVYSCESEDIFDCLELYYIDEEKINTALVDGLNVLSIQIHNFDGGLDDMSAYCIPIFGVAGSETIFNNFPATNNLHTNFNLSSKGQRISLKDPSGSIVDEFIVGETHYNHSRGRVPDGSNNWCLLEFPTPCLANSTDCKKAYAETPLLNLASGFYDGNQLISISTVSAGDIHYTTDGSLPTISSALYTSSLLITESTTLRASTFPSDTELLPSNTVTGTYIIDDHSTLPVILITVDSLLLFDTLTGIYVLGPYTDTTVEEFPYWGTANFHQDIEVQGHVEYLDANQQKQMGQDCAVKIHGNFSRGWPQKSFRFIANDKYGDGWFNFSPFPGKSELNKFKSFNVRNGGVDYNTTHFRDGLMHRAIRDINLDYMDHQPCLVYLNGVYWGVYGLRERQDEKYLATNYDINGDLIDLLRFSGNVFQGSNEHFLNMVDFIVDNDMTIDSNYTHVEEVLDIENFCDYMLTETYYGNYDWIYEEGGTNNIKFWRSTMPESKWRYILWDTDLGLVNNLLYDGATGITFDYLGFILDDNHSDPHSRMLLNLLDNETFRNYFINRFADLVNTTFSPETFIGVVNEIYAEFEPEMERHFEKWGAPPVIVDGVFEVARASNVSEWTAEVDSVINFIEQRPYYSRNNMEVLFSLNKQVDITLDIYPAGAGKIKISTITPNNYPWTGVYYDGVPVTISIIPNSGYKFINWTAENASVSDPNKSLTVNFIEDEIITANFEIIENNLLTYPNPFSDLLTFELHLLEETQATIKIYDLTGRLAATIIDYDSFQPQGVSYIKINPANYGLKAGAYIVVFKTNDVEKTTKLIRI